MAPTSSHSPSSSFDHLLKLLIIGDSGVGKTSILSRFSEAAEPSSSSSGEEGAPPTPLEDCTPTVGVDLKLRTLTVMDRRVKLTVWDTAGQEVRATTLHRDTYSDARVTSRAPLRACAFAHECPAPLHFLPHAQRFRTLTSSYYRGAHGVVFVYDCSNPESLQSLESVWRKEVELYATIEDAVHIVVGNKIDRRAPSGGAAASGCVAREEGERFAREHGALFVETSALNNVGVSRAFEELVMQILQTPALASMTERRPTRDSNLLRVGASDNKKEFDIGSCCRVA